MKTVEVTAAEILVFKRLQLISKLQPLARAIELFVRKYGKGFAEFEAEVVGGPERFELWDDYMEWKACEQQRVETQRELKELDDAGPVDVVVTK